MPSRDFRGILKMSLFHCSYFIKQLPNGFPSRIADVARLSESVKIHSPAARVFLRRLFESLATSLVHGSRNSARKTIRYSFILLL